MKRKRKYKRRSKIRIRRKRNPVARPTNATFNKVHLDAAEKMLCMIDNDCPKDDPNFVGWNKVYSGQSPWNKYSGLELYVWEKPLKYTNNQSVVDWLVVDPKLKSRAVGTGQLWKRKDGDGYDTGSVVLRKDYRRKGIYTGVVESLRQILGMPLWSDRSRTAGADKVWRKYKKMGRAEYYHSQDRWRLANPKRRIR